MSDVNATARVGFSAGAEVYVAGRPDYPPEIAAWLTGAMALGPDRTAVDLGAGTGKFTPLLLATGAHVIAVEPVPAMRARLAEIAAAVEIRDGVAEALPLPDASADVIVCAQAFHWFATHAALAEMRRVLKIGGRLGLIWNVRDETAPWVAALAALIAPYEGDTPRYSSERWRDVFPAPGFSPLVEATFPHVHVGPPERVVVDRLLSTSFVAALDAATRADIASAARRVLSEHGVGGAQVGFPYQTRTYACIRIN
jgi:SAM-dependent methyltransferase